MAPPPPVPPASAAAVPLAPFIAPVPPALAFAPPDPAGEPPDPACEPPEPPPAPPDAAGEPAVLITPLLPPVAVLLAALEVVPALLVCAGVALVPLVPGGIFVKVP